MNNVYRQAEIDYRRGRLIHDFTSARRSNPLRRMHGRRRQLRPDVVPPYGDARA